MVEAIWKGLGGLAEY